MSLAPCAAGCVFCVIVFPRDHVSVNRKRRAFASMVLGRILFLSLRTIRCCVVLAERRESSL